MVLRGGALVGFAVLVSTASFLAPVAAPAATTTDPPRGAGVTQVALAPAAVSASSLATRITALTTEVTRLENRAAELDRQLADAGTVADSLSGSASEETRSASALLATARRQAIAAYMNTDPAAQSFALINAVGQGNVNDVTWSLGIVRASSKRTLKLAREARKRSKSADASLTDALSERDRLTDDRSRLDPLIAEAKGRVLDAEAQLEAYVKRLGPGTITGMTTVAYDAYKHAELSVRLELPSCGLRWELLAAIGKTESNHGMGRLDSHGTTTPPILGIPIGADTDQGLIDTDPAVDHAIGPMQFIPSTWRRWGADGNADGVIDVNNIYDEALAAGRYLCSAAGADTLATRDGVIKAIWAYNPNADYLRVVGGRYEALASDVAQGWFSSADLPTPDGSGSLRPVADATNAPVQPTTNLRAVRAFSNGALAVATVAADPVPGICGRSALMPARVGVLRCDVPTAAGGPVTSYDPCMAAPHDTTLVACFTDLDAPVVLVRASTAAAELVADGGTPYFAVVLEGGDRCVPVPSAATARAAATVSGAGKAHVPRADPTTTTTAGGATTTTGAATTTTRAPATTTTTRGGATTTTRPPATTTPAPSTTVVVDATTTTTTIVPPGVTLPPPAVSGGDAHYRCASGAEITGNPVPGVVPNPEGNGTAATTTTPAPTTTTLPPTTVAGSPAVASSGGTWVAQVTQTGIAPRTVAVLTLYT